MKMDQIAFYCVDEDAEKQVKSHLCLEKAQWVKDTVVAENWVRGQGYGETTGELQYNYDLGIELEILCYIDGVSWHHLRSDIHSKYPFISHIGIHLDADGEFPGGDNFPAIQYRTGYAEVANYSGAFPSGSKKHLVQRTRTLSHTNPYVVSRNRTYEFEIYQIGAAYIKYIKRIENNV